MTSFLPAIIFASALLAQGQPAFTSVGGTVASVSNGVVVVTTGAQALALTVDVHTTIWKGKDSHDLSLVHPGDKIIARCSSDFSGRLTAETMWLNIVNFFAGITKVNANGFEALANPNADPDSAYKKEIKTVTIDSNTEFIGSAAEDFKTGRGVQVTGVGFENGDVLATRITVYEGRQPVRMRKDIPTINSRGQVVTAPK